MVTATLTGALFFFFVKISSEASVKINFRLYSKRMKSVEMIVRNSSLNMIAACCVLEAMLSKRLLSMNAEMAVTTRWNRS